jgi:hypothetical protein
MAQEVDLLVEGDRTDAAFTGAIVFAPLATD